MEGMMRSGKSFGRVGALFVIVSAAIAAALVGGASSGRAATGFDVKLLPLIGTAGNEIPQVSYGGKIGYHLRVENTGDSSTQHASIVVTSDLGTFSDSSDTTNCAVNPKDSHQLICTPFGGTFVPGALFEADLRFNAPATGPAAGEDVSTSAAVTVAAQTVGGGKNKGTTIQRSDPVLTNIVEKATKADTYLHGGEGASTSPNLSSTHRQNFGLTLPGTLLDNEFGVAPFGIALSIHDQAGDPLCTGCVPSWTELTIPAASVATQDGNPFYDGTTVNAYSWSMTARYPSGYKFTAVIHIGTDNVPHALPTCGAPTAGEPMCYDADSLTITHGNTPTISVTGKGIANGNITFG
jgi:hypothetical protein